MGSLKMAYSLLTDELNPISNRKESVEQLKAHLIHTIIFCGEVVVSDNQVLCSPNLFRLVKFDPQIQSLISTGYIKLALRKTSHTLIQPSLQDLHPFFLKAGKIKENEMQSLSERISTYRIWEEQAQKIPFDIVVLEERFTTKFQEMCTDSVLDRAPRLSAQLSQLFQSILEENRQTLGRIHASPIAKFAFENNAWEDYQQALNKFNDIADAIYLSGLPDQIERAPIYSVQQQASLNLMRGSDISIRTTEESIERKYSLGRHQLVAGLNSLGPTEISKIHESAVWIEFREVLSHRTGLIEWRVLSNLWYQLNRKIEDIIIRISPAISREQREAIHKQELLIIRRKGADFATDVGGVIETGLDGIGFLGALNKIYKDVITEQAGVPDDRQTLLDQIEHRFRDTGKVFGRIEAEGSSHPEIGNALVPTVSFSNELVAI